MEERGPKTTGEGVTGELPASGDDPLEGAWRACTIPTAWYPDGT